jgi:hypothetical protein
LNSLLKGERLPDYVAKEAGDDALSVGDTKQFGAFATKDKDRGEVTVSFYKLVVNRIKILRDNEQGRVILDKGSKIHCS